MDILNKKERISALVLFLIMFVIAIGVLMTAIFFSQKLPTKENEVLRKKNEEILYEIEYQRSFLTRLKPIIRKIDSLDKIKKDDVSIEAASIQEELGRIRASVEENDSIKSKTLYLDYISACNDRVSIEKRLQDEQEYLREISKIEKDIDKKDKEIDDLETKLRRCEIDLEAAKR